MSVKAVSYFVSNASPGPEVASCWVNVAKYGRKPRP